MSESSYSKKKKQQQIADKLLNNRRKKESTERLNKVKAQGEKAERQGKLIPRELRQISQLDWRDDNWDSAKIRDTKTRQGQNYWRNFAKTDPVSALENRREYMEEQKNRKAKKNGK